MLTENPIMDKNVVFNCLELRDRMRDLTRDLFSMSGPNTGRTQYLFSRPVFQWLPQRDKAKQQ
jgi:hypothetical protein